MKNEMKATHSEGDERSSIGAFMLLVTRDATGASLSKAVSRSRNAAQSTQACAAYRPQLRVCLANPSVTTSMGDVARGGGCESGVVVVAAVEGGW